MFLLKGLNKSQKVSRLIQVSIATLLTIALLQLWYTSLQQGKELLKSQTEKMARLVVQQTAYAAAPALQLKNSKQLTWLVNTLVQDPKVKSATIFNADGERLYFSQSITEEQLAPESEQLKKQLQPFPPYVEPITQNGIDLGFIEVRLDPKLFFDEIKEAHNSNMKQQQLMLVIAGIIGMLLSRALSFKRAWFARKKTLIETRKLNKRRENSSKNN